MPSPLSETQRVQAIYDGLAERYDRVNATWERLLFEDGRHWVCSQARGAVLEVGVGTGRNLSEYPADVHLIGIELSPTMLAIAADRARQLQRQVDLRQGDAQSLPFADASFDTVIVTLSLCTIPDERRAIDEMVRVLKPGGRLIWLEHVRSHIAPMRWVQRLFDPLLVRREADHLLRDPVDHLQHQPVVIEQLQRSKLGYIERGVARKSPATPTDERSNQVEDQPS